MYLTDRAFAAPPDATIVVADNDLSIGETSLVTITFSEAVTGFTLDDLTAENGTLSGLATSDNITYTATLTPDSINDPTNVITLDNAGVENVFHQVGIGTTESNNYSIDIMQPAVASVSVPAGASYGAGKNLDFTVQMSEPVFVTGTPGISLIIGATVVQAVYESGSGTDALLFRYTVQAEQTDANGISVGAFTLNGGSIKDHAGNDAVLTLSNVGSTTNVIVDTTAPTITSVAVPNSATYKSGDSLDFTVTMSKNITVTGTPQLTLIIGGANRAASYSYTESNKKNLHFIYTVQSGDLDIDGIDVGALLRNDTIHDDAGNPATSTLNNVSDTTGILVDAIAPKISSISVPNAGSYKSGDSLDFTVTMSENITVTGAGTPLLEIHIGGTNRTASLISGTMSDTHALQFRYTVQAGDDDNDGIAVGALTLDGGSIKDHAGNDAILTLNNVGNTSGVLIDTTAPTITGHFVGNGNAYIDVMFSEGVYTTSNGTGALTSSDLRLNFARNDGNASAVSIHSLKKTDGGDLIGGETAIRVNLDVTGIPTGNETIEVVPEDGASIFDLAGNAVAGSQSSGTATLLDMRSPFINPTSASFDKYAGAAANRDVTTTLALIGNTLTSIANGGTILVSGTDYTVSGNTVTILKSYLAATPVGTTSLTFTFSAGAEQSLAITVSDTTPSSSGGDSGSTPSVPYPVIDMNGVSLNPDTIDTTKPSYTLEVTPKDGVAYVSIPASIMTGFEGKNAAFIIEIKAPYGSYQVPVNLALLIPGLKDLLAANHLKAEDISFKITLSDKSGNKNIQAALANGLPNSQAMGAIVDFHVETINSKTGKTVGTADQFNQKLTRVIPMPKNMTVIPEQWGAFRYNEMTKKFEFVPAKKVQIDGVWYVMISSFSNSVYVVAENAMSFIDMLEHWGKSFVQLASAKGLVDGVGYGKYDPNRTVTRAEFTAMLVRSLGRGTSTGSTLSYDDVKSGAWYFDEITKAKELGLLNFVQGNSFMPDQPLTREEMASMLAEVISLEKLPITKEFVSLDDYKDIVSTDKAYLEDVRLMVKLQIMTGTGANSFSPKGETTRAQAAVVFIRMLQALGMIDK
ncbi:Ig-like domain-containing protein [Paenibacillus algorifonticola]|uniref:Ig-like domain-containing protein n=1 Tax=Paenibacillus algorifonticola TaxID=684063 RepID=UPI003D2C09F4